MRITTIIRNLSKSFNSFVTDISYNLNNLSDAIDNEIIKQKSELMKQISVDYNLDYNELHNKYIGNKKNHHVKNTDNKIEKCDTCSISYASTGDTRSTSHDLHSDASKSISILEKILIDNIEYYVEKIEDGAVYTKDGKKVGEHKNDSIFLYNYN